MNLAAVLLGTGAIVTVLIQGFKTIPFVKNNTWVAFPAALILGILCVMIYANISSPHFIFNWAIVWIGLSVGLIAGGYYAGSTSTGTTVSAIFKKKDQAS